MADPLSMVASLIAVIQLSGTIISTCYDYRRGVKSAHQDLARVIGEVASLRDVLEQLLKLVDYKDISDRWRVSTMHSLATPDGILAKCKTELMRIEGKLEPAKNKWKAMGQALMWPLKEGEIAKELDDIARTKSTLSLALLVDQTTLSLAIQDSTVDIKGNLGAVIQGLSRVEEEKKRMEFLKWIAAPNYRLNHSAALKRRRPGTGLWFLESEKFSNWKAQSPGFIWLYGIPGCGKTILCCEIIEHLSRHCLFDEKLGMAYYYFDFSNTHEREIENFLSSLILQLCGQFPLGSKSLSKDPIPSRPPYTRHLPPTSEQLRSELQKAVKKFEQVYIVVDAMDECEAKDELFEILDEMMAWTRPGISLLVTGRKLKEIDDQYSDRGDSLVSIDSSRNSRDISSYIRERINTDKRLKKWPEETRGEIETVLVNSAQGMWRWVVCQLDALCKCVKLPLLLETLHSLPKTLDETYYRILSSIEDEHRADAMKLLHWAAFSARPLGMDEVVEVLAFSWDSVDDISFDTSNRILDPNDILEICPSLIVITSMITVENSADSTTYKKTEDLRLAHFTVKEFLVSTRLSQHSLYSEFTISEPTAHNYLALSCLIYLLEMKEPLSDETFPDHPFARYAAEFWISHTRRTLNSEVLHKRIMELLQEGKDHYINWLQICNMDRPWQPPNFKKTSRRASPLYYGSLFGLDQVVEELLDRGVDANSGGGRLGTPLQAAAAGGHLCVVQQLISRGAKLLSGHLYGTTGNSLMAASRSGHLDVVRVLLDVGVDIEEVAPGSGNALMCAAAGGHREIVELLLDHNASPTSQLYKAPYSSPLNAAISKGDYAIVELLLRNFKGGIPLKDLDLAADKGLEDILTLLITHDLDKERTYGYMRSGLPAVMRRRLEGGADINERWKEQNYLIVAILNRDEVLANNLLDRGADPNQSGAEFVNALDAAASVGSISIMKRLIAAGLDVNARGAGEETGCRNSGSTALKSAASSGHCETIRVLLDAGADISDSDILTAAATNGHLQTVKFLVAHGALTEGNEENMIPALVAACKNGHAAVVSELLLERSAVNDEVLKKGLGSALEHAADQYDSEIRGHAEIVKILLEHGAPTTYSSPGDVNALQYAARRGHDVIVRMLVDAGADVNAQGGRYGFPLYCAVLKGHTCIARLLLDNGADITLPGGYGDDDKEPLLLRSVCYHNTEIVQLLLDYGADANELGSVWGIRQFPLHAAASSGKLDILRLLLSHGARVDSQDKEGRTALHEACRNGKEDAARVLVTEHGADIEKRLSNGSFALHCAAEMGYQNCVQFLLDSGNDINSVNFAGLTALHWAAKNAKLKVIQLLVGRGADVNIREEENGMSALDMAESRLREMSESKEGDRNTAQEVVQFLKKCSRE